MTTVKGLSQRLAKSAVLGAAAGALFLGVGGRVVMRLFAIATNRSPAFSLSGTINVVVAGAIAGGLGALLLVGVERLLPSRRWLRNLTFGALTFIIAIPGFRPPHLLVFILFGVVFLGYGLMLGAVWDRVVWGRPLTSA